MMSSTSVLSKYVLKRVLQAIPLIFVIIILSFLVTHLAPGDPILYIIGEGAYVSPEYIEMLREMLGLNQPLHVQLFIYLRNLLQGDLGYSFIARQPVMNVIMSRVPATLLLMGTQLILSSILGIVVGVTSSKKPNSFVDNVLTTISLLGYSLPVFWLGQMLILFFAVYLGVFPISGMYSLGKGFTGVVYVADVLYHLALPCFALTLLNLALIARLTRGSMLEVLMQDFITTARSKGLDENTVTYKHALRNALLPVITMIGLNAGWMFSGAIITETVFAWPGLGRLLYDSIYSRDYPVIMGLFIITSILVIVANLITDIIYALIDPRIRYK